MQTGSGGRRVPPLVSILVALLLEAGPTMAITPQEGTAATLAWSAASGPVAGYRVYVWRDLAPWSVENVVGTTITLTAEPGESALVWVQAYGADGATGPLSEVSERIEFSEAPAIPPPVLSVSTSQLSTSTLRGLDAPGRSFHVSNAGGGTLSYRATSDEPWIALSPASGSATTESDSIGVAFATTGLASGVYTGTIRVERTDMPTTPEVVAVSLTVIEPPPAIGLSTTALSASLRQGDDPAAASFQVQNTGGGTLAYTVAENAAWLTVDGAGGTSTGEVDSITIHCSASGLEPGTYSDTITVAASGLPSRTIDVTFVVTPGLPVIELSKATVHASVAPGQSIPGQTFTVRNAGFSTLSYTVSADHPWLTVGPASGASTGEADTISVDFARGQLAAGTHRAIVTVSANGLASKSLAVSVQIGAGPARFDLDGDGRSDALFRATDGALVGWVMDEARIRTSGRPPGLGAPWSLAATGDFDGDGRSADLLWHDRGTGRVMASLNDGSTQKSLGETGVVGAGWQVSGIADVDGDGRSDVLWLDALAGTLTVWRMEGPSIRDARVLGTVDPGWRVAASGDFDGDGRGDVLFERSDTKEHSLWLLDGPSVRSTLVPSRDRRPDWTLAAAGDFNGDGKMDVLASYGGATLGIQYSTGTGFVSSSFYGYASSPTATVVATGDYDGDAREDVLWFDPITSITSVWRVGATWFAPSATLALDRSWIPLGTKGTSR